MADETKDNILEIRGMCKSFGRNRVLDHINLDVKRGTIMGLMGENGAGKSTMMRMARKSTLRVRKMHWKMELQWYTRS